jgi:hypothetical protein
MSSLIHQARREQAANESIIGEWANESARLRVDGSVLLAVVEALKVGRTDLAEGLQAPMVKSDGSTASPDSALSARCRSEPPVAFGSASIRGGLGRGPVRRLVEGLDASVFDQLGRPPIG